MEPPVEQVRTTMLATYGGRRTTLSTDSYYEEFVGKPFSAGTVAERFHENSKYTGPERTRLGRSFELFASPEMSFVQALTRPDYPDHERVSLPEPAALDASLDDALAGRRSVRAFSGRPLDRETLATLLGRAVGVTARRDLDLGGDSYENPLRAYPSGGGLYPVETYVAVLRGDDPAPGLYFYVPEGHYLRRLERGGEGFRDRVTGTISAGAVDLDSAAGVVLLTGVFWRSMAKYGPRGYRFVLQESGHVVQNLQLVAGAVGLGGVPHGGFYDDRANELLGVDGVDEATVYAMPFGEPAAGEGRR